MPRRLGSVTAGVVAVMALVLATPGVATAAVLSGTRVQYRGPGTSSYGAQTWNTNSSGYLQGESYVSGTLTAGWCLDSLFDWYRPPGHHDARVWRTCRSNAYISYSQYDSASGLGGMQKAGTCYGLDQKTNKIAANCTHATDTMPLQSVTAINVAFPNNCGQHRTRMPDNTISFHDGGDPTSCGS